MRRASSLLAPEGDLDRARRPVRPETARCSALAQLAARRLVGVGQQVGDRLGHLAVVLLGEHAHEGGIAGDDAAVRIDRGDAERGRLEQPRGAHVGFRAPDLRPVSVLPSSTRMEVTPPRPWPRQMSCAGNARPSSRSRSTSSLRTRAPAERMVARTEAAASGDRMSSSVSGRPGSALSPSQWLSVVLMWAMRPSAITASRPCGSPS